MSTEASKKRFSEGYRKREVIDWSDGEREALIAEALAQGKARKIEGGVSGHETSPPAEAPAADDVKA